MQYAALDNISSPPKLTGTPFSAVSRLFQFTQSTRSKQSKCQAVRPACQGFQRVYGLRLVVARLCRQTGANALSFGSSIINFCAAKVVDPVKRVFHLNRHRRIFGPVVYCPEYAGIGEGFSSCLRLGAG